MGEEWRAVVGWEGLYEVSSLGRVRSLDRATSHYCGGTLTRQGRELKPRETPSGHLLVALSAHRRMYNRRVHRLVLEAFVGPCPEGMEVRHLNGHPADNRVENLVWGTRSENTQDQVLHGVHNQARKQTCPEGHEYDYVDPKGKRRCKRCNAAQERKRYWAVKEA